MFDSFLCEFFDAAKGVPIQAAFRYDRGNWRIAMNYKSRQSPLTFLILIPLYVPARGSASGGEYTEPPAATANHRRHNAVVISCDITLVNIDYPMR